MAGDYNLGTAEGTIKINYDGSGAKKAQVDFGKTEDSAKKSGKTLNDVGAKAAVGATILAAGLAYVTKKAVDFEKEISQVGAVSGASGADLDALRAKALKLGADTSFSASEAAQAMEELAKAGISTKDILSGAADATVSLAAAGGVALPEAASIAANAMNLFGITASQMPKVVDQIAGAANNSAIDVSDFGFSMSQVGAVAKLAGISFEDTATAITLLGQAGIKGSDAGTSMKTFLQNLIPTTKEQITLSKKLGLITKDGGNAFFDASGKAKSLADISGVLQTALKGQTKEQQLATLQTLFGSDAIRAAAVLAESGATGFNNMAAALNKTSAADVAAARLDNTAGKIEAMKGSIETAAISLGTLLLPHLAMLAKQLTTVANWFSSLSSVQQTGIVIIIQVVAGILLLIGTIAKVLEFIKVFKIVWKALNVEFLFSPIGLVILAIIALVAIIVLIATKTTWFQTIWAYVWGFMKTIGAWFAGPFAAFFVNLWAKIFPVLQAIGAFFVSVWNMAVNAVKSAWAYIQAVINFWAPSFSATFGLIVDIFRTAWAIISAVFAVAAALIRAIFGPIISFIVTQLMYTWAVVSSVMSFIWNVWLITWNAIRAVIVAVWGFIAPYIIGYLAAMWSNISSVLSFIWAIWTTIWGAVKSVTSSTWSAIVTIFLAAKNRIIEVIDGVREILSKIRNFFNQLKDAANGGTSTLLAFVAGIPGRIIGALGDLGGMLFNSGWKIIQGLVDGIKSGAGKVKDAVQGVLDSARSLLPFSPAKEGPFSGSGWTLYSGQAISEALATGIRSKAKNAVQATLSLVQDVRSAVNLNPGAAASSVAYSGRASSGGAGGSSMVQNNSITVNAPAPIVDPSALAEYTVRKLNSTLNTRSIPVAA